MALVIAVAQVLSLIGELLSDMKLAKKKKKNPSPFFFFFFFCLFRAVPAAYGGSQARGGIGSAGAGLHHSHSNANPSASATHATVQGNSASSTH